MEPAKPGHRDRLKRWLGFGNTSLQSNARLQCRICTAQGWAALEWGCAVAAHASPPRLWTLFPCPQPSWGASNSGYSAEKQLLNHGPLAVTALAFKPWQRVAITHTSTQILLAWRGLSQHPDRAGRRRPIRSSVESGRTARRALAPTTALHYTPWRRVRGHSSLPLL